jgi:hypothetical protein
MANRKLNTTDQKRSFLTALEASIYRGLDYVSYGGNQLKYRSFDLVMVRDNFVPSPAGMIRFR